MKIRDSRMLKAAQGVLVLGLTVSSIGCTVPESAVYAERGEPSEGSVLAVVGGVEVTEAEVAAVMSSQLRKVEQERYNLLMQGLDRLVADRLVEMEAQKRGITPAELIALEVEAKADEPTQGEIDAFYAERQSRIRKPQEEVEDQIRDFLVNQSQSVVREAFVQGLKNEYGYQLLLEPIRIEVASDGFPAKGAEGAPVTIVEFSDFECPYCARVNPAIEQVMKKYGNSVRLVFRQFPLNIHPNAQKAAEASLCAEEQGKFWEMHDAMFKEQRSLGVEQLKEKAARLDLDAEAFNKCLDSSRHAEAVLADLEAGGAVGVSGTPAFFINGRFISGAQPYAEFAKLIDEELAMLKKGS